MAVGAGRRDHVQVQRDLVVPSGADGRRGRRRAPAVLIDLVEATVGRRACGQTVPGAIGRQVGLRGRQVVGVDDCDRHARALSAGRERVGAPEIGRAISAAGSRLRRNRRSGCGGHVRPDQRLALSRPRRRGGAGSRHARCLGHGRGGRRSRGRRNGSGKRGGEQAEDDGRRHPLLQPRNPEQSRPSTDTQLVRLITQRRRNTRLHVNRTPPAALTLERRLRNEVASYIQQEIGRIARAGQVGRAK